MDSLPGGRLSAISYSIFLTAATFRANRAAYLCAITVAGVAMNTVKRFVCYYAGINIVLAALLLAVAWFSPEEAQDMGTGIVPVSHMQEQAGQTPAPLKRT